MHKITSLELLRNLRQIFMSFAFLQKVILELKCTNTSLELLRTPIFCCLVQMHKLARTNCKKQMCEATDAQNFFLSQKKLLNVIFKSKAQLHEKCFFLMK